MEHNFYQQDKFNNRKWFKLNEDGLLVKEKSFFKESDYFVDYEHLGTNILATSSKSKGWFISAIIFSVLSLIVFIIRITGGDVEKEAAPIYLLIAIGCGVIYAITHKRIFYITLPDKTNAIEFLAVKSSKENIQEFITLIKEKKKEVLLERYGVINKNLSYETQYNNLIWLRNHDVLTKDEYNQKLQELEKIFTPVTNIIGFGIRENNFK